MPNGITDDAEKLRGGGDVRLRCHWYLAGCRFFSILKENKWKKIKKASAAAPPLPSFAAAVYIAIVEALQLSGGAP
jgi:hypothetical protein